MIVYEFEEVMNLLHIEQREAVNREIAAAEQRGRDAALSHLKSLACYQSCDALTTAVDGEQPVEGAT